MSRIFQFNNKDLGIFAGIVEATNRKRSFFSPSWLSLGFSGFAKAQIAAIASVFTLETMPASEVLLPVSFADHHGHSLVRGLKP